MDYRVRGMYVVTVDEEFDSLAAATSYAADLARTYDQATLNISGEGLVLAVYADPAKVEV